MRDKTFGGSGLTPRGVVNGWFNVTPLASATGQLAELSPDLCYDEWVREMVQEHLTLAQELDEVLDQSETVREAYANETRKGPRIQVGNLVFLRKGQMERAATAVSLKLLSKCDGPYVVAEMPTEQNAVLTDPLTEERIDACSHGRTVAVDRLVLYPVSREDHPRDDEPFPEAEVAALGRMDLVAMLGPEESIVLAQVDENHPG